MTEEEAISICKNIIRAINGETCYMNYSKEQDKEAIETLLELYHKKQEKLELLANGIRVLGTNPDITTEEIIKEFTEKPISEEYMKKFKSSYISKDEVLKALGYEENDEEYKRIYNKEELILSLIRTINEECDRLEDIEDKKVEVAVDFIEEKRDKYWQDKIRKKLEKLKEKEQELSDEQGYWGGSELQAKIEELEEMLGEL